LKILRKSIPVVKISIYSLGWRLLGAKEYQSVVAVVVVVFAR
jgi:hypothetical protein